jgi:hypothetical protein
MALLAAIKRDQVLLDRLVEEASGHWGYEDPIYRFWHQSMKVFSIQEITGRMVEVLRGLSPGDGALDPWFETIISEGTGRTFVLEDNARWLEVARPMLEAFFHARFMVEVAARYGRQLEEPPALLPSGWAALLHLYGLR